MAAYGEVEVETRLGRKLPGVAVDLLDPATLLRIPDTVFADNATTIILTLPLLTDQNGRVAFYLTAGKLVNARYTDPIFHGTYDEIIAVVDPTASAAGGAGGPVASHSHVEGDVTSLVADLTARAFVGHTHPETDVTALVTDLSTKSPTVHTHAETDVTNLGTDLAAKVATSTRGVANGVATLDNAAKLPAAQLTTHTHPLTVLLARIKWDNPTGADIQILGTSNGAATVTAVRSTRVGATGAAATVNFRLAGTTLVLAADQTAGVNPTWTNGTTIANAAVADLNQLEGMLQSITGAPSTVVAELWGTRNTG